MQHYLIVVVQFFLPQLDCHWSNGLHHSRSLISESMAPHAHGMVPHVQWHVHTAMLQVLKTNGLRMSLQDGDTQYLYICMNRHIYRYMYVHINCFNYICKQMDCKQMDCASILAAFTGLGLKYFKPYRLSMHAVKVVQTSCIPRKD